MATTNASVNIPNNLTSCGNVDPSPTVMPQSGLTKCTYTQLLELLDKTDVQKLNLGFRGEPQTLANKFQLLKYELLEMVCSPFTEEIKEEAVSEDLKRAVNLLGKINQVYGTKTIRELQVSGLPAELFELVYRYCFSELFEIDTLTSNCNLESGSIRKAYEQLQPEIAEFTLARKECISDAKLLQCQKDMLEDLDDVDKTALYVVKNQIGVMEQRFKCINSGFQNISEELRSLKTKENCLDEKMREITIRRQILDTIFYFVHETLDSNSNQNQPRKK